MRQKRNRSTHNNQKCSQLGRRRAGTAGSNRCSYTRDVEPAPTTAPRRQVGELGVVAGGKLRAGQLRGGQLRGGQLGQLAERVRPAGLGRSRVVPASPAIADLLPDGGL